MPQVQAEAFAKLLHIPPNLLHAMQQMEEFRKFKKESDAKYSILGFDPQKAAEDGKNLTRIFRNLYDTVDKIAQSIGSKLFGDLKGPISDLNDYLLAHGKEIADTIVKIADALFRMLDFLVRHLPDLDRFVESIGGWGVALTALAAIISASFVGRVLGLLGALRGLSLLAMPPWALAVLGLGAGAAVAAKVWTDPYGDPGAQGGTGMVGLRKHQEDREEDAQGPLGTVKRAWKNRPGWMGGNGGGSAGKVQPGGWWTPEREKHAFDTLTASGVSERGAIALISRWKNVESHNRGPDDLNPNSGAYGIEQGLGSRKPNTNDFDEQLKAAARETRTGDGGGSGRIFDNAQDDREAARGASVHERAEGWNGRTDNFQNTTLAGMAEVRRNVQAAPPLVAAQPPAAQGGDADWQNHRGGKVPMPKILGGNPFGGLNPDALRATMSSAPPLGGAVAANKNVSMHQTNNVSVQGVSDPTAAAAQIGARHDKHSSMVLRNMRGAIV